jgi:hypothetical protein
LLAERSHWALLAGEQLICLMPCDDPRFTPSVGDFPLMWKQAEWLNASRGL